MKNNPRDFRIGNLVQFEGRIFEIDVIANEFPTLNTTEFGIGVVDWNNIEPIPVTKESLIKFGFTVDGNEAWKSTNDKSNHDTYYQEKQFVLLFFDGYWHFGLGDYRVDLYSKIEFEHQLQNAFYLTGKELTTKKQ